MNCFKYINVKTTLLNLSGENYFKNFEKKVYIIVYISWDHTKLIIVQGVF